MKNRFLFIILVSVFFACSRVVYRTVYRTSDALILNRINKYFDTSSEQEVFLKYKLREHLQWHKANEMPKYETILKNWKTMTSDGLSPGEVDIFFAELRRARKDIMKRIKPDAVKFLSTLDENQISHFEKNISDFDRDLLKNASMPPDKRKEERTTKLLITFKDWIGKLTEEQEKIIKSHSNEFPDFYPAQLQFRKEREKIMISFLRSKPDERALADRVETWLVDIEKGYPDYYKNITEKWNEKFKKLILNIDPTLTGNQKAHANQKIDVLIKDIQAMRQ